MNAETGHEPPLPHNDGEKTERIDLGLAILSALAPPHAVFDPQDIAAWCGCTPSMISSIEARALRRLREKMRVQFKLSHFDMIDHRSFLALHFQS